MPRAARPKQAYRHLRAPWVRAYGVLVAALLALLWALLRLTVRVRHHHRPPDFNQRQTVDCAWHDTLLPYFVAMTPYTKRYAWMNHPAWYMKGIHVFLRWMGVRQLVLGSSGHGGRAALDGLVALMQTDPHAPSTFLNPDGPYGPAHQLRPGVLDIAQRTGAPIIALRIHCHCAWRAPTWDGKAVPLPFSRIDVIYSPPWHVRPDNREAVREALCQHLNSAEPPKKKGTGKGGAL